MEALICSVQKQKAYALIVEKTINNGGLFMTGASHIQTRRLKIVYKDGIYKVFIFVLSTGKYLYSLKVKQIHPSSFRTASDPGGTTQVASYSSIIHGPCLV